MLLLTRRPGETIQIGPDIRVTITKINGQQAQIGIEAPDHIEIIREELLDDDWDSD